MKTAVLIAIVLAFPIQASAIEFTTPPPTFEDAVAAAKRDSKPLVLEFSATWCEPCKKMATEFHRPEAKPALDAIHLVVYQGDDGEVGESVMQRFGARSFPTFIAFDQDGKEINRRTGYVPLPLMVEWFKELPDRALPLADFTRRADAAQKDGRLQLVAARRLMDADRQAEAKRYFTLAARSSDKPAAATAAWALARMDYGDGQLTVGQKIAEKIVKNHAASAEGEQALQYLAALPKPPVALIERGIVARLETIKNDVDAVNNLVYIALKAGATTAAGKLASRLQELAPKNAMYLDTVAETFHMKGDSAKAVEMEEQVMAMAGKNNAQFVTNLERFRRGKKEPARELVSFRGPRLEMEKKAPVMPVEPPVAWIKAAKTMEKRVREECWQFSGNAIGFYAQVLTARKSSDTKILVRPGTPRALEECASKVIRSVEIEDGRRIEIWTTTSPKSFDEAIDKALAKAKTDCREKASGNIDLVLYGEAGQPGKLAFTDIKPELQACVEQAFAGVKTVVATLRPLTVEF